MSSYTTEQIQTLNFRDAMRSKVAMYSGSADNNGVFQVFKEVLGNAIDEFMNGFGDIINVVIEKDGHISVLDSGRGIPFSSDVNDKTFINIFTASHTSGKFDHKAYKNAVGLHGIGSKLAALSSLDFRAESFRNGKKAVLNMEKGKIIDYKIIDSIFPTINGSYIRYKPDPEVFHVEPININPQRIIEFCRICSFLNGGLQIRINDEINSRNYSFKSEGIIDLILEDYRERLFNPLSFKESDDDDEVEICYTWTNAAMERYHVFVNGMEISDGGSPITGFRTGLTRTINNLTKSKYSGENVRRGIVYIINIKCLNPSFSDQRKSQINNLNLRSLCDRAISESLKQLKARNSKNFEAMVEIFSRVQKAEVAAEKARQAILNHTKDMASQKKKKIILADKLKDCERHDENSILMVCEGDSALGALAQARPIDSVALLPVRGKIISSLKNSIEDVLENEEVKALFSALDCGIMDKVNLRKMRYGYVGIAVDQDFDGKNIGCLLITLFYVLCPEILKEGRLVWINMPLYSLEYKNEIFYAFSNEEKEELLKTHGRNCSVSMKKGIGENTIKDTQEAVFGKSKRWDRLFVKDWDEFQEQINMLMGKEVAPRKDYIMNNVNFSSVIE